MNSLAHKSFDEKLDQLLTSSVSPGAEPEGFQVGPMPSRPVFSWSSLVSSLIGVGIFGFFATKWLLNLELEKINDSALFTVNELVRLVEALAQGHWATMLGLVAALLVFLPEKLRSLYQSV